MPLLVTVGVFLVYLQYSDLSKEWYIDYYVFNAAKGKLERERDKIPLSYASAKQRRLFAKVEIADINALLDAGFHFVNSVDPVVETSTTLKMLIASALKIKSRTVRKKSLSTYTSNANKFLTWLGVDESKGLDFINKTKVSEYIDFLLDSEDIESNITVNNVLNITKGFFLILKKREIITHNPFVYEKLTETETFRNKAFSELDQSLMEAELKEKNFPLYVFTRFMYYNFIRPTELRQLKIEDIDFKRKTITVYGDGAKSRKTATIPLHPILFELVKDYEKLPKYYYLTGKDLSPGIIKASENTAYNQNRSLLADCEGLEGEGYTLYSWRHCGAVRAYEAGTDILTLQFLFRHSTILHTEIYLKSLRLQLNKVVLKDW